MDTPTETVETLDDEDTKTSLIETPADVKRVGFMWDTESLGLDHGTIVREIGFDAFDLDDPERIIRSAHESLPLLVQEQTFDRRVSLETCIWLMDQPESVKQSIKDNIYGDIDELLAVVRSLIRKFNQVIQSVDEYEVWFARPQHDVPLIQSLFKACGEKLPWAYNTVNDLRTLMKEAGLSERDPALKERFAKGLVLHTTPGDCRYQIRCYAETIRRLRAHK